MKRFDVFLVNLDPILGKEIKKTRPAIIISPDEMNAHISNVIIAPMTTKRRPYPSRVSCKFQRKNRQIILDQIRKADKSRLVKKLGRIGKNTTGKVLSVLQEIFYP
jgi:mRNA interferase MazF